MNVSGKSYNEAYLLKPKPKPAEPLTPEEVAASFAELAGDLS